MKLFDFYMRALLCLAMLGFMAGDFTGQISAVARAHKVKKDSPQSSADRFEQAKNDIGKTLDSQSKAWNDGDLAAFMSTYSKRADTSYVSRDAQVYGYEAIEARYEKRYGDNRESMGTLSFSDLKYVDTSATSVICIGHWQVEKKDHQKLSGVFSLIFVKEESGWKILHDHTS